VSFYQVWQLGVLRAGPIEPDRIDATVGSPLNALASVRLQGPDYPRRTGLQLSTTGIAVNFHISNNSRSITIFLGP
jgi:hypothetical protein